MMTALSLCDLLILPSPPRLNGGPLQATHSTTQLHRHTQCPTLLKPITTLRAKSSALLAPREINSVNSA